MPLLEEQTPPLTLPRQEEHFQAPLHPAKTPRKTTRVKENSSFFNIYELQI
jgi:hypothetical protein